MPSRAREHKALRGEVERELRRFVRVFDAQPELAWEPAEVSFVRAVRPKLKALDDAAGAARAPPDGRKRPGGGC